MSVAAAKITPEELSKRLGLSPSTVQAVRNGEVVAEELEASSDKDLSLIVCTIIPASVEKAWEFLQANRVSEIQAATISAGPIDPAKPSVADMVLEEDTLRKLAANPGGMFFMSKNEDELVRDAAKRSLGEATKVYYNCLSVRAGAYWERGLEGIVPYEGKGRDPRIDLKNANEAVLKLIQDPIIRHELQAVPSKSERKSVHSLGWTVQKGRDQESPVLNHYIRYKNEAGFISVTRRFYSGYDYDSSQVVTGVLPTEDGRSAIFYINRTFTAKVAGFGGIAKRSVGRKMMKQFLVETMERAKKVGSEL